LTGQGNVHVDLCLRG